MSFNLKVLIIESDMNRVEKMKTILGEEFYSFDEAQDLKSGFKKISQREYDIIISSIRLPNSKEDASKFLERFETKEPDKLKIPYIFFKTSRDEKVCENIKGILSMKKTHFINKDYIDYLYELEWAILKLVPKIFYNYRKSIDQSLEEFKKTKEIAENLEKKTENIQDLHDEQEEIKKNYVQWKNIAESLGTLVGAFSLVMGIIISLVLLLSNKSFKLSEIKLYYIHVLVILFLISLIWGFILLLYFKLRSKIFIEKKTRRYIEDKANKIIEKKINEILEKREGSIND